MKMNTCAFSFKVSRASQDHHFVEPTADPRPIILFPMASMSWNDHAMFTMGLLRVLLYDPADRVAGVPNSPLTLTLLSSLDNRRYIVCSFAPCNRRTMLSFKMFHDRHERIVSQTTARMPHKTNQESQRDYEAPRQDL
jgi:hypothetical protein